MHQQDLQGHQEDQRSDYLLAFTDDHFHIIPWFIANRVTSLAGYRGMSIDRQKNAVTVKGTMDMRALANRLSKKLNKRPVSIAPPDDHGGLQADADSPSPEKDMVGAAPKPGKGAEPQKDLDGNKSNKVITVLLTSIDLESFSFFFCL